MVFQELIYIYKNPKNTVLTVGVFLFSFFVFTMFEKLVNGAHEDFFHTHNPSETFLLITTFSLIGVITVLFKEFYVRKLEQQNIPKVGGIALFMSVIAVGCVSCGTAVIIPLSAAIGLSGIFLSLPFAGKEIQLFGIILLIIACCMMLLKLNTSKN